MPIVDTRAFGETVKLGRFIIRFSFFALFALFDREKNKKRYSTDDTVADENQFKISRQTRCVFCRRSLSSWSLFSSLVARVSMVCCASSFYISLEKEELFYSDDYSRAKSARDDAARSASFFEC